MRFLPANVVALTVIAPKKIASKYALENIAVRQLADGRYLAEATDSRIFARITGKQVTPAPIVSSTMMAGTTEIPVEHPAAAVLTSSPNAADSCLIPSTVFRELFAVSRERKRAGKIKPHLLATGIAAGQPFPSPRPEDATKDWTPSELQTITLATADGETVNVHKMDVETKRWPPIDDIIHKKEPRQTITIDANILIKLLTAAAAVDPLVTLEIFADHVIDGDSYPQTMQVRCKGCSAIGIDGDPTQEFIGAIMQMSEK